MNKIHLVPRNPKAKCIAWLNGTSVAIGTEMEVRSKALDIANSERWKQFHVGKATVLNITTYGSQRLLSTETL